MPVCRACGAETIVLQVQDSEERVAVGRRETRMIGQHRWRVIDWTTTPPTAVAVREGWEGESLVTHAAICREPVAR